MKWRVSTILSAVKPAESNKLRRNVLRKRQTQMVSCYSYSWKILPLAPSSTIDNARDIMAGEKNIFLAKLFPQLCSCNWNGNCDLVNNKKVIIWHFCNLFSNYEWQKGHNFPVLWPFQELWTTKRSQFSDYERHCEWQKGHNFVNDKTYWFTGILWYNIFSFSVRNII